MYPGTIDEWKRLYKSSMNLNDAEEYLSAQDWRFESKVDFFRSLNVVQSDVVIVESQDITKWQRAAVYVKNITASFIK